MINFSHHICRGSEEIGIQIHQDAGVDALNAIIINCPGYRGTINGWNDKYITMANYLAERRVGAVIRMPNITRPHDVYMEELHADVLAVIDFAIDEAKAIAGNANAPIYLVGFSAGGQAVAAVAAERPQVEKVLLMAPSGPIDERFSRFGGEVYIVIGEDDDVVGADSGMRYFNTALSAKYREHVLIPNCDHQFRGRINGQIMAKAYLWAFAGDKTFPNPDGAPILYE